MKLFREQQVYLSPEVYWYARVKTKRLVSGTKASMTVDQFVDGELRNLFTVNDPELVVAWEKHCKARQDAKKAYDKIENEAVGLVPELAVNHVE